MKQNRTKQAASADIENLRGVGPMTDPIEAPFVEDGLAELAVAKAPWNLHKLFQGVPVAVLQ